LKTSITVGGREVLKSSDGGEAAQNKKGSDENDKRSDEDDEKEDKEANRGSSEGARIKMIDDLL
jgi:hypothetical protein